MIARESRRRFLRETGALVAFFSLPCPRAQSQGASKALPGSLKGSPYLDAWIRIDREGKVTLFTGKAELGQGIKTALLQLAAEELAVPLERIELVTADTALTPNEGYTSGSRSMQDSGTAIRHAAAQVRALLVAQAAQRLGVSAESLSVSMGSIHALDGRTLQYGELVAGQVLHVQAEERSAFVEPGKRVIAGKSLRRVDIPAKVAGGVAYVHDLRFPGMVHARIVRPPSASATLVALDASEVERMPTVLKVVRDGRFIGVIAEREYECIRAARSLAARAKWEESASLPPRAHLYDALLRLPAEDHVIAESAAASPAGGKQVRAEYRRPYQMHAAIGPSCAVAELKDGKYTVWTHSQGVYPLRDALAELLAVPKEAVRCIHAEGSGCYGHNGADDVAADAALLARSLPGRPVRVQWMREDEHAWEPFGAAMVSRANAVLDASGTVAQFEYEVWSNTHSTRPGKAGNLLAGLHVAKSFEPPAPRPIPQPEGGGDRNAIPLYAFPGVRVVHRFIPQMPLRVSALRGLGAYMNVFSLESFMDELTLAAGADPVEYRLRHLRDARGREVIRLAAEKFGWSTWRRRPRAGRGFAFARYKNLAGYLALAMEVEVGRDTGAVQISRVVAAADSGEIVNPDGLRNQIEGGIVQSASWTLSEEVAFDDTRITSRDWAAYPILRFPAVPRSIEVHLVDRPGQPFLGTGEVAQGPTAACIANALADATGMRVRELPFSPPRLRRLFAAG